MVMFKKKGKEEEEKKEKSKEWFYAKDLLKKPEKIDKYTNHYLVVVDHSMIMKGHGFSNLSKVLHVLAERGWRLVDYEIAGVTNVLIGHAILEREE